MINQIYGRAFCVLLLSALPISALLQVESDFTFSSLKLGLSTVPFVAFVKNGSSRFYSLHHVSPSLSWNGGYAFCNELGGDYVCPKTTLDLNLTRSLLDYSRRINSNGPNVAWFGLYVCETCCSRAQLSGHFWDYYFSDGTMVPEFFHEGLDGPKEHHFSPNPEIKDFYKECDDVSRVGYIRLHDTEGSEIVSGYNLTFSLVEQASSEASTLWDSIGVICVTEGSILQKAESGFVGVISSLGSILGLSLLIDVFTILSCIVCCLVRSEDPCEVLTGTCRGIVACPDDRVDRWQCQIRMTRFLVEIFMFVVTITICIVFGVYPGLMMLRSFMFALLELFSLCCMDCIFGDDCVLDSTRDLVCNYDDSDKEEFYSEEDEKSLVMEPIAFLMSLSGGIESIVGLAASVLLIFAPIEPSGVVLVVGLAQLAQLDNSLFSLIYDSIPSEDDDHPLKFPITELDDSFLAWFKTVRGIVIAITIVGLSLSVATPFAVSLGGMYVASQQQLSTINEDVYFYEMIETLDWTILIVVTLTGFVAVVNELVDVCCGVRASLCCRAGFCVHTVLMIFLPVVLGFAYSGVMATLEVSNTAGVFVGAASNVMTLGIILAVGYYVLGFVPLVSLVVGFGFGGCSKSDNEDEGLVCNCEAWQLCCRRACVDGGNLMDLLGTLWENE